MPLSPEDFLLGIFEQDEQGKRGIFQQFGIGQGRSALENEFGQTLFQPLFNRYLGGLAGELGDPSNTQMTSFKKFTQNPANFDFNREFVRGSGSAFSNERMLGRSGTQFDFGQSNQSRF